MSIKRPEIGDKVRLKEGTITYDFKGANPDRGGSFHMNFDDGTQCSIFGCQIEEIIPKPWKVGDKLFFAFSGSVVYTIEAIVGTRVWVSYRPERNNCTQDVIISNLDKNKYTLCAD